MKNYFAPEVTHKGRKRFKKELLKGRMLGRPGWTAADVENFLHSTFYVTPCGAVPKGDNPHGRIIHDYSYAPPDTNSLNSCLLNTSVTYISFIERARKLAPCNWYFAVDLENGYRQLPVHPSDWHTQVYSLGPDEYYMIFVCRSANPTLRKFFVFGSKIGARLFATIFKK